MEKLKATKNAHNVTAMDYSLPWNRRHGAREFTIGVLYYTVVASGGRMCSNSFH